MSFEEDEERLKAIAEREMLAASGPWRAELVGTLYPVHEVLREHFKDGQWYDIFEDPDDYTAQFVAHSRDDIPWLLHQVFLWRVRAETASRHLVGATIRAAHTPAELLSSIKVLESMILPGISVTWKGKPDDGK